MFSQDEHQKELASKYFAKMVSPAYQILNSDRERGEYFATLRLLAQNLKQKHEEFTPQSEVAKKLFKIAHETTYIKAVNEVAALQYQFLDKMLDYTTQLSELNMIYLITQQDLMPLITTPKPSAVGASSTGNTSGDTAPKPPAESKAKRNMQMAEVYISKKQWAEALKELQAGEKLDPNSAKLHALIGLVHMNRGVSLMAKNSFQKALKLDPKEPTALKYIKQVEAAAKQPPKKEEKKGGLFGWGKK